jgi:hypothetical protein
MFMRDRRRTRFRRTWVLALLTGLSTSVFGEEPRDVRARGGLAFEVTCLAPVEKPPRSARVYVMLGDARSSSEPRLGPDWSRPQPFFARDIENWKPGEPVRIDDRALGFPTPLGRLKPGRYAIQAVVRLNPDTHRIGNGEGNAFGPVIRARLDPNEGRTIPLAVTRIVEPRTFPSSDQIKLVELPSPKLSAFYHRPITQRAAVILPGSATGTFEEPVKVPALYIIPGFGGDHFRAPRFASELRMAAGADFVRVLLDPDCETGHHVFADSATNGPRAAALVEELIPYIQKTFPVLADTRARLLGGHSSGGWSSLWLQVTYPDVFGGTWSTSPDPVDFRDFQGVDVYAPGENVFRDREGKARPIARMGGLPFLYFEPFSRMDDVIGRGGQLGSFEAVFSPSDGQGRPRKLWNRATGAIDPEVAKAWEKYDIRLVLERNWPRIGPKLKGKLHVITGAMDDFYLEGAVKLLKESLARLGSDAVVEIVPKRDHSTLLDANLAERIDHEMHAAVATAFGQAPSDP